MGSRSGYPTNG